MSLSTLEISFSRTAIRRAILLRIRLLGGALFPLLFGDDHLDDLAPPGQRDRGEAFAPVRPARDRGSGFAASAKCAITCASIGSVLARLPRARGEVTYLGGIDHGASGSPAPARGRRHHGLIATRGFHRDQRRRHGLHPPDEKSSRPLPSRATAKASPVGRKQTSSRSFETSIPT